MIKYVPHFFTSLSLVFGCIAVLLLADDNFNAAVIFCLFAFLFDFADGFFARLLKTESAIGRQLDSFSDFVTSGVVPGFVMYKLLVKSGLTEKLIFSNILNISLYVSPLSLIGFFITIATAFRLSKFNLMNADLKYFLGLPAPANSMMIIGLPFIFDFLGENYLNFNLFFLIIIFSCYILNSKLKFISLKNTNISIILLLFIFLGTTVLSTNFAILTIIILIYILSSFIYFIFKT